MERAGELESSLLKTVTESDLAEVAVDAADAALDEIPIVGLARKLWRATLSVQNYFYVKKVIRFLSAFKDVPVEQRREQVAKMIIVPGEKERFGEHICLVLDRLNDLDKATLMGRVALAMFQGRITLEELRSLNFAIDAVDLRLLPFLKTMVGDWMMREEGHDSEKQSLAACGLVILKLRLDTDRLNIKVANLDGFSSASPPGRSHEYIKSAKVQYAITHLGKLLVEVCLEPTPVVVSQIV